MVSDVVDAVVLLVRLAIGVDHKGLITFTGEAIFLEVSFFLAVPALGVGITEWGRATVVISIVVVTVVSAKANCPRQFLLLFHPPCRS